PSVSSSTEEVILLPSLSYAWTLFLCGSLSGLPPWSVTNSIGTFQNNFRSKFYGRCHEQPRLREPIHRHTHIVASAGCNVSPVLITIALRTAVRKNDPGYLRVPEIRHAYPALTS